MSEFFVCEVGVVRGYSSDNRVQYGIYVFKTDTLIKYKACVEDVIKYCAENKLKISEWT